MVSPPREERRRYERYESDLKIEFSVNFDVQTKIDFRVKENAEDQFSPEKYSALSRNISVEGLCFLSEKKLLKGDFLLLDVYVPSATNPIRMEGAVRWSHLFEPRKDDENMYETGVKLLIVDGKAVEKTVIVDKDHNIVWSVVLETVFGTFKQLALKRKSGGGS